MSSYGMPMPNDNNTNANPDGRPLPPGWITEYDNKYVRSYNLASCIRLIVDSLLQL